MYFLPYPGFTNSKRLQKFFRAEVTVVFFDFQSKNTDLSKNLKILVFIFTYEKWFCLVCEALATILWQIWHAGTQGLNLIYSLNLSFR